MLRPSMPLALAALAVLGACGSDATPTATTASPTTVGEATFPVTVAVANGEVTVPARPTKIISLSPTATEMLFAIGAGGQVVAVDDQSTYPPEAPKTDLSGFEPNLEAIAAYEPDLVVVSNDIKGVLGGLQTLDIPALLLPAAAKIDDTYAQLEVLGDATGATVGAAEAVAAVRDGLAAAAATVDPARTGATYFHELDPSLYTAVSSTFIGQVYALAGLVNVADAADDGSGYPQLSAEFLVQADPDLIFLADTKCCQQDATTVAARPGWEGLTAVRNGGVVNLDDDIASRWGPRVVDFLDTVVAALAKVPVG